MIKSPFIRKSTFICSKGPFFFCSRGSFFFCSRGFFFFCSRGFFFFCLFLFEFCIFLFKLLCNNAQTIFTFLKFSLSSIQIRCLLRLVVCSTRCEANDGYESQHKTNDLVYFLPPLLSTSYQIKSLHCCTTIGTCGEFIFT